MRKEADYQSALSTDEKVLMAIVRTAEIFKRAHSVVFRNHGLSFPQYNVLRVLESSGNGHNKISDVSRIMLVPGANMTGIVKRLARAGFIVRKSDPSDERVTMLQITPKGRKTLRKIEREKDEWLEVLLRGFSRGEKVDLLGKVGHLIRNNIRGVEESFIQRKELRRGGASFRKEGGIKDARPRKPPTTQPVHTAPKRKKNIRA
jgi:DNA-binding MarR family transcriptional regulator